MSSKKETEPTPEEVVEALSEKKPVVKQNAADVIIKKIKGLKEDLQEDLRRVHENKEQSHPEKKKQPHNVKKGTK